MNLLYAFPVAAAVSSQPSVVGSQSVASLSLVGSQCSVARSQPSKAYYSCSICSISQPQNRARRRDSFRMMDCTRRELEGL